MTDEARNRSGDNGPIAALAGSEAPSPRSTGEGARGLLYLRLAAVLVSLTVIIVAQAGRGAFQSELLPTYCFLVFVCLVNVAYLGLVRRVRNVRRFTAVQIYLDLLFAGVLIYLSGAGDSRLGFLHFACILAGSTLLGLRAGVMLASLATTMLAGMRALSLLSAQYGWTLPWVYFGESAWPSAGVWSEVAHLMTQAVAYYLVAVLAGNLARRLSGIRLLNENILRNVSDGVLVLDGERRVRSMNREAVRLLGLPALVQPVGRKLDELIDMSENAETLRESLLAEDPGICHQSLVTAGGRTVPVAFTTSVLRDDGGMELGLLVIMIDLTERKRLEEALERAQVMEMMGHLAACIAHEIRNPLACIRGSAQEVRSEFSDDGESARLLDLVIRESDRINTIVTDFLHFSRMRRTALARCNLAEVLSDVVTMLRNRPASGTVRIELDAPQQVFCLGDVEQLRQVFLNLGLNALDAMPRGGRLTVSARRQDGAGWTGRSGALLHGMSPSRDAHAGRPRVVVELTDEGEGMTEEVRERIFSPFFTTKPRGTGLGLPIVRRIVEAHKGGIEVESAVGRGSTFRVVLEGCPEAAPEPFDRLKATSAVEGVIHV